MRGMKRLSLMAAVLAMAGCAQRSQFFRTYERTVVGQTTRADVDRLFPEGPVRAGLIETFMAPSGDPYVRLRYAGQPPRGVVVAKHFLRHSDRSGPRHRTLRLSRLGVVQPEQPARYRRAIEAREIDPLIDLLAPTAGTLRAVLNETPYVKPEFSSVVSIRDEFRPEAPDPPPGQRHLPEVHQSHLGFGRWALLTSTGDLYSTFFVPGRIYPGSHSYKRAFVDEDGFLTFLFHFENYGETVDTIVAVKEDPAGTFHVRYETTAVLVREP
jgi:hypothetical protein